MLHHILAMPTAQEDIALVALLKACAEHKDLFRGHRVHAHVLKKGLLAKNRYVGNTLVSMYAKCGALDKARRVLEELPVRNVISWNALITGYAQHGESEQALNCFEQMQHEGLSPDEVTFICILKACGSIGALDKGEKVHDEIAKQGLLINNIMLGTALVDMYAKCGALAKAQRVLANLSVRDVISWNALITGYVQQGEGVLALKCFEQMECDGLSPNTVTFISILKACGSIGACDKGEKFHKKIAELGLLANDVMLGTALVDMYAKCGALTKARGVLEELRVRNVISWNALIAGYVQQGEGKQALNCLEEMQCEGLCPDAGTFSCVLNACGRFGLVDDAQMYFMNMRTKYAMKPNLEHYTCMVDLFGRAGHLHKAVGVIEKMPSVDSGVWSALLSACRKWGDVNVARWAFKHALQAGKTDAALPVLMADNFAAADMQEDAENIVAMRIENNAGKNSTQSWGTYLSGNALSFSIEDNHIYVKLEDLGHKMPHEGNSPSLHWVSRNICGIVNKDGLRVPILRV